MNFVVWFKIMIKRLQIAIKLRREVSLVSKLEQKTKRIKELKQQIREVNQSIYRYRNKKL